MVIFLKSLIFVEKYEGRKSTHINHESKYLFYDEYLKYSNLSLSITKNNYKFF